MTDTENTRRANIQTARDIISIFFLKKRAFSLTFIGVIVGALLLSFLTPPIYQTTAMLLIKPQYSKPLIFDQDSTRAGATYDTSKVDESTLNTFIFLLSAPEVLREVVMKYHLAKSDDERDILEAMDKVRARFKAEPQTQSSIIQLTYRGGGAREVADQLNTLVDAYIRFYIQTYQSTKGRFAFFDDQTQQYRNKYLQVTNELVAASKDLNVIKPDLQKEKGLSLIRDLELNKSQLRDKMQLLRDKNATFNSVLARLKHDTQDTLLPSLPQDAIQGYPALVEMEKSLAQLLINRQRAHADFYPGSKPVVDADNQYNNMKVQIRLQMQQITHDLGAEMSALNSGINDIDAQIKEAMKANVKLTGDALTFESMELEQRMNKDNYVMYNTKKEEARINDKKDQAMFANIEVVARPSAPTSPWFPQRGYIMLLSIPLALILAMAVSAGSYAWEKRVWTPTDLSMHTQLYYLGSLDAAESKPARRAARWSLMPSRRNA